MEESGTGGEGKEVDSLRKTVSEMSVEELEEIVSAKKRGRPKNKEKELKQLRVPELQSKKSTGRSPRQNPRK